MHFATLNDTLMAYRHRTGAGPVVVLIHALGCDQSIWDGVLAALGPGRATLTYDLRGHGASGQGGDVTLDLLAADLIALLERLELREVILCGVSIGGMIAQGVAATRPDLVRGLVLGTTATRIGTTEKWDNRMAQVQKLGLAGIADEVLDLLFPVSYGATRPDDMAGHRAMLLRNDPVAYAKTCAALRDADLSALTGQIHQPTICISGSQDRSVPPAQVALLADRIAGATHLTLAGSGHLPCLDAPEAVAAAIREVIARAARTENRAETGTAVRRAVLGDAHVDRAEAARTPLDAAFQRLITEGAWGTVWASDAITLRERSMLTLALLAGLGNFDEIPMHIRATLRTGASAQDIAEVFQHVAIYAGLPRANHALKLARQTLDEMAEQGDG